MTARESFYVRNVPTSTVTITNLDSVALCRMRIASHVSPARAWWLASKSCEARWMRIVCDFGICDCESALASDAAISLRVIRTHTIEYHAVHQGFLSRHVLRCPHCLAHPSTPCPYTAPSRRVRPKRLHQSVRKTVWPRSLTGYTASTVLACPVRAAPSRRGSVKATTLRTLLEDVTERIDTTIASPTPLTVNSPTRP